MKDILLLMVSLCVILALVGILVAVHYAPLFIMARFVTGN
jgi:hypothetical protein